MTRARISLVLVSLVLAAPARAQDAMAAARTAVMALDDDANAAWLYGRRTLDDRYDGPSRAESLRALAHGARLIAASERAVAALRAAGREDAANDLSEGTQRLAESLCPEMAADEIVDTPRSRLADACATTSDLIQAVRDFVADVRAALDDLRSEAPGDCALAHRVEAARVRTAMEEAQAQIGLARSMIDAEWRRELVGELRQVARDPRGSARVQPQSLGRMFPQPLIDRYSAALDAMRAPGAHPARTAAAVASAARALAAAPNPIDAEVASLRRSITALERVLAAWRTGAPERTLARHLASARGTADVNDILTDLEARLREAHATCSGS